MVVESLRHVCGEVAARLSRGEVIPTQHMISSEEIFTPLIFLEQ